MVAVTNGIHHLGLTVPNFSLLRRATSRMLLVHIETRSSLQYIECITVAVAELFKQSYFFFSFTND
jgi:hypothetical protein